MRAGDDVHADQLAFDGFDGLCAGIGGRFDGRDIADDNGGNEGVADLCMGPASSTLAALSMASVPSTRATKPRVSRSPIA